MNRLLAAIHVLRHGAGEPPSEPYLLVMYRERNRCLEAQRNELLDREFESWKRARKAELELARLRTKYNVAYVQD